METKFTAGPWYVGATRRTNEDVLASDGPIIANALRRKDEREANAHLIAAAPDLLAALHGIADAAKEAMLPGTSANTKEILLSAISEDARAAIAKATGKQS